MRNRRSERRLRDLNPGWGVTPNRISSVQSRTVTQAGAVGDIASDLRKRPDQHELVRGGPALRVTAV